MDAELMTAPDAPPAPPPLPPAIAPVAPERGSPEWLVLQIEELQEKMDRIIKRFM